MSKWAVYLACVILFSAITLTTPLPAAIYSTGNVNPADPSTWDSSTIAYIGNTGTGSVIADGGSDLVSYYGYLGYYSDSSGEVTIDGIGSTWNNSGCLEVGLQGDGTLTITNGGAVISNHVGIGPWSTSTGEVTVDGIGSTLTDSGRLGVGHGTLNITDGGTVSSNGCTIAGTGEVTVDGAGSTWTNLDHLFVINGTTLITDGGTFSNSSSYIGYISGSTGEVTVDGPDSTWTNTGELVIGNKSSDGDGNGMINITNGGTVTVKEDTRVATSPGSSGRIHFDNGTLTTGGLCCDLNDLTGTGTLTTHGLVADVDLVFDATHGLNKTFNLNRNASQNIVLNLDVDGTGSMGAGYSGTGTMRISDGMVVESAGGFIGYKSGSRGEVTVNGTGSTWSNSGELNVGIYGNGKLNITGGGIVKCNDCCYLGYRSGTSTGALTVDGTGSTWTNSGRFFVGWDGSGALTISDGGTVSTSGLSVGVWGNGRVSIVEGGVIKCGGWSNIGNGFHATSEVTVDGAGSTWTNSDLLRVGFWGKGTLTITDGGLVSVGSTLTIDYNGDGDSFINMSTGGMLALFGETDASGSIDEFLELVEGTDAIQYWDGLDWARITGATYGEDYSLEYLSVGDLAGYTMLTVGVVPVPEPGAVALILIGLGTLIVVRRRR